MPSDLYSALIGAPVDSAEKQAALADLLRRKSGFAQVAQLSGDPVLSSMGQQGAQQTDQQAQQIQRAAQAAQQAQLQQAQETRQAAGQQEGFDVQRRGQDLTYRAQLEQTMAQIRAAEAKADKPAQPTESERKNATLATRLEGALRSMDAEDVSVQKPGLLEKTLGAVGLESAANTIGRSGARQRVDAAQVDALDAALTLGTGASYTKEQLESQRKAYFPQIGDDAKTVAAKKARFDVLVKSARSSAGRAGGAIDEALTPNAAPKRRKFNPATGKIE